MIHDIPEDVAAAFKSATKRAIVDLELRSGAAILDKGGIEKVLPHRDPMLFVDAITHIDAVEGTIAGRHGLAGAGPIFEGHFPEAPMWPGIFQVEALGQVGLVHFLQKHLAENPSAGDAEAVPSIALTHVLAARFLRSVVPGSHVELVAKTFDDGLFFTIVGQCLQNEKICSVAAISTLV